MKAPDIVESWKWQHGEKIIERLLGLSSGRMSVPANQHAREPIRDRYFQYYVQVRKQAAMRAAKEAMGR